MAKLCLSTKEDFLLQSFHYYWWMPLIVNSLETKSLVLLRLSYKNFILKKFCLHWIVVFHSSTRYTHLLPLLFSEYKAQKALEKMQKKREELEKSQLHATHTHTHSEVYKGKHVQRSWELSSHQHHNQRKIMCASVFVYFLCVTFFFISSQVLNYREMMLLCLRECTRNSLWRCLNLCLFKVQYNDCFKLT